MPNILRPPDLAELYIHQLKQTIEAYSSPHIVVGEVMQNAIDAICKIGGGTHNIHLVLNFDDRSVIVRDDGSGFPNDISLLFLGGSQNREESKKIFGHVGVGLKVVLFNTNFFQIRSNNFDGVYRLRIDNAYRFDHGGQDELNIPDVFPIDTDPLDSRGTELAYSFPVGDVEDIMQKFVQEMIHDCLPQGIDHNFGKTIRYAKEAGLFQNRFAALLVSYLRRFTYVGDILNLLGEKNEIRDSRIRIQLICTNPSGIDPDMGNLFDDVSDVDIDIPITQLTVEDTATWVPQQKRPGIYHELLGRGGQNLSRTWRGFDSLRYSEPNGYESLLVNRRGNLPPNIEEYRTRLFPRINGILLTIGRVAQFEEFIPGGSRRILSANGVVTHHDLDIERGRNLEFVRCFDFVMDLDATLNYGKTQITDPHLIHYARRFINDAYAATIQFGAGNWVGRIQTDDDDDVDVFLARPDLGLREYVTKNIPKDENDVIGLFFELAGHGIFPGYRIFGLSQSDKYDSRALIKRVGEVDEPQIPQDERGLAVVEFKRSANLIIRELEQASKSAGDIDLLIAWNEGASASEQFGFADIEHSRYYPDNIFPKVQRYLLDTRSGRQVQVLLLEPIVHELLT